MPNDFHWGHDALDVTFRVDAGGIVRITAITAARPDAEIAAAATNADRWAGLPVVEVLTATGGKRSGGRYLDTVVGRSLRYESHRITNAEPLGSAAETELTIELVDEENHLHATVRFTSAIGIAAFRSEVTVTNRGSTPSVLLAVSIVSIGFPDSVPRDNRVSFAHNDWMAEFRWVGDSLRALGEPDIGHDPGIVPRGRP